MNGNHIFHAGIKLTRDCEYCKGIGQLKAGDFQETILFPTNPSAYETHVLNVIIVMCEACVGHGVVVDDEKWWTFKLNAPLEVIFDAEQYIRDHLKPEYES